MYDPHAALEAIDSHTLSILLFYAVAVLAGFVYFIEAIRLTISQKVYAVPLATAIFIFAHDLSFLVYYDKWFNQYGHWWCKAWWFVLLITVPLEMLLIYFVARYGRAETFPFLKQKGFTVLVILATVGLSVFWLLVKDAINDELYFVSFAVTVFSPLPFSTALMIRRQSRQGQSVLMQLTQIPQALALLAAYSFIDSYFYSPIFISFILVIVTWACVNIWLLRRLPENSPARVTWRVMGLTVRPAEELARVGCAMATLTDLALPVAPDDRVVDDSLKLPWSSADDNDDARLPAGSTSATPSAVAFDPPNGDCTTPSTGALCR